MDAIDILGGLLGQRSGGGGGAGGGLGTKILKDILGGAMGRSGPAAAPAPAPSGPPRGRGTGIDDLEDLLNVARGRRGGSPQPVPQAPRMPQPAPTTPRPAPAPAPQSQWGAPTSGHRCPSPPQSQNDQAVILIRAMVNAAKADGQVTPEEQQNLINQVGGASQEAIQFLRQEFAQPLNVRDFAWSVPLGMEEQVYAMSLAAIDLDTNPEAQYLQELAHGLRLPPDVCNELHRRVGAPPLF